MDTDSVRADRYPGKIGLAIDLGTTKTMVTCDKLVIACDPRNLDKKIGYTTAETSLFDKLQNFTFHTTLLKMRVTNPNMEHGVVFAPEPMSRMKGHLYGYRNETAKTLGLEAANKAEFNWVTVYQLYGETDTPPTEVEFEALLRAEIATQEWWPFAKKWEELHKKVLTEYFDHFHGPDLQAFSPWDWHNLQGDNDTIYVHASTCFESVVHCWYYINWLFEGHPDGRKIFPENLDESIVILGAGVSGLLTAEALLHRGHTDVRLFEKTKRYGGKTHTIEVNQFDDKGQEKHIYCELGTCYLSPHYTKFVTEMRKRSYLKGNTQLGFGGESGTFRGILTKGQFSEQFRKNHAIPPTMPFPDYVKFKAADYLKVDPSDEIYITAEIELAAGRYLRLYFEYFGTVSRHPFHYPMPAKPPKSFLQKYGDASFEAFLKNNDMSVLIGIMQYAYSVQGYGTLDKIPAYYGMLWITPDVIEAALEGGANTTLITAWSLGWGDLWKQMHAETRMDITLKADVTKIWRPLSD